MPGRRWYWVALGVFVVGAALAALFVFSRMRDLGSELRQVVVPGQAELTLEEPGTYTIFHEHESTVGGRYYSSPPEVPGLEVQVVSASTGRPVELRPPGASTSYSLGGRSGVSIFSFEIDDPGAYRLAARYPGDEDDRRLVLAVGHGFGTKLFTTILGGIGIGFLTVALAVTIAAVTFWKRRRAAKRPAAPQPGVALLLCASLLLLARPAFAQSATPGDDFPEPGPEVSKEGFAPPSTDVPFRTPDCVVPGKDAPDLGADEVVGVLQVGPGEASIERGGRGVRLIQAPPQTAIGHEELLATTAAALRPLSGKRVRARGDLQGSILWAAQVEAEDERPSGGGTSRPE